jgi:murein DD-endopeptidase MepM/ murein hydrolase activator NlpD
MAKVSPVTGKPGYPGAGWIITSQYLDEAYFRNFGAWHTGHDLAKTRQGGEPIYAVEDGIVKWAEFAGARGFGNLVTIQHRTNLYSRYGHLARIDVQRGQAVTSGQQIGTLGNTGRSTAPHLHFDIMRTNNALDWPGVNKQRVSTDYWNPSDWYSETVTIETGRGEPPEFLRIIAPNGLNVRARPSASAPILTALPFRTILEVKRAARVNAEGFLWRELTSGGWIVQVYTEALPAEPLNPPTPPVVTPTPNAGTVQIALRGVHANAGGWQPQDREIDLIRANKPQSILIVTFEGAQAQFSIPRYREAGIRDFIVRAAHHGLVSGNPQEFIDATLPKLKEYQQALGETPLHVAVHNEPNVTREGWRSAWQDGAGFSQWYTQVIRAYRDALPGVKIGFPALSPGGDVQNLRMDEWRFAEACTEVIAASDWVGVHAYYVGDGNDIDLKPDRWRQMAQGRSIIVTEGGPADGIPNSAAKAENVYRRCAAEGFPCMAWLVYGAGQWASAGWVENDIRTGA